MPDLGNVLKQYLINTLDSMGKDVVKQIDKWAAPIRLSGATGE